MYIDEGYRCVSKTCQMPQGKENSRIGKQAGLSRNRFDSLRDGDYLEIAM